ncbi:MAG: UDP-N-acetylglucosamine 2-epimerase [Desulfomonilaceae bacterium]
MRTIGVVTGARSDYGIYLPILRRMQQVPELKMHLIVTGMHLAHQFGFTVETIEQDGFEIGDRIEMLLMSDTSEGLAKSLGVGVMGFAESYARCRPDVLLVLGDRLEMLAAVAASLTFNIPVAHIHGGESTEGAIDELIRHAITKMSHLHFASTESYARRIIQMGEEPWRVVVSGAPSLDNLSAIQMLSPGELKELYGLNLQKCTLLVTYHPVTLELEETEAQVRELMSALEELDCGVIFTYPNADAQNHLVIKMIHEFHERHQQRSQIAVNLGTPGYFSLMSHVAAMVGNSSSGIIEAASFKLPVVNIGNRQSGRLRGKNVIDVCYARTEIADGIRKALSAEFKAGLSNLTNPYGDGRAAGRIVDKLKQVSIGSTLLTKRFSSIQVGSDRSS